VHGSREGAFSSRRSWAKTRHEDAWLRKDVPVWLKWVQRSAAGMTSSAGGVEPQAHQGTENDYDGTKMLFVIQQAK